VAARLREAHALTHGRESSLVRTVVLANRFSGRRARGRVTAIAAAFAGTGLSPEIQFVAGRQATLAAQRAVAEGAGTVVAAGGDGTVGAVAAALAGTQVAMGILPLGTLNHFARDAGIPLGLAEAVRTVATGRARPVDVAEVNGRVFVNNSSIGLYPHALGERARQGGPKRVAMVAAAWAALQRLPAHRVLVAVDGRPEQRVTPCVFVGNNPYETSFGRVGHRAALDTGRLGVYTIRRASRPAVLALAVRALAGRLDTARDLGAEEASTVTIASAHRRTLRVALDGEVARLELPLRYRIRPGALRLLGPEAP
jgi:diacylglycerol kinase family enzyme